METSPLAAVRLVLRQKRETNASDVVGVAITDFLVRDLSLREACDLSHAGSTALLEFVWARDLGAIEREQWSVGRMLHTQPHYARWAFTRAMVGAVRRGDLAMVQWLRKRFPDCPIYVEVLGEACKCGRLEALQLLHSFKNGRDFQWDRLLPNWAANFGHWDVIHWVYEHYPGLSSGNMLGFALKASNLEEIKWITAHFDDTNVGDVYLPYSEETWQARKDCVRYLVARGRAVEEIVKGALQTAAEASDLQFVQWLMTLQLSRPQNVYKLALNCACEHGHVQVVQSLLTRMEELRLRIDLATVMRAAARNGQLTLMQWVYELYGRNAQANVLKVVGGPTAMEAAAQNGHLEVVQFLHRIDVALEIKRKKHTVFVSIPTCSATAMDAAAGAGHLAVVKWLHTNRSEECTAAAMDGAAAKGHLDVVEWLHSNRREGCTAAAMDGVAGRVYHESGCRGAHIPCCVDKRPDSFVEDQIAMLVWLRTNRTEGCTSRAVDEASCNGNLAVLQWLRANTMARPSSQLPMEAVIRDGRLDVVKWLHLNYPESSVDVDLSGAAVNGHLEVVKWISSNLPGNNPGHALIAAAGYSHLPPTGRHVEVVQYLLPKCAAVDIQVALGQAVHAKHFEIVLLLHTTHPTLTSDELQNVKSAQRFSVEPSSSNREICEWIEENYPFDSASE
jgi:hypothetical protein